MLTMQTSCTSTGTCAGFAAHHDSPGQGCPLSGSTRRQAQTGDRAQHDGMLVERHTHTHLPADTLASVTTALWQEPCTVAPLPWRVQGPAPMPAIMLHQQWILNRSPAWRCLSDSQFCAMPAGPNPRSSSELCTWPSVLEALRQCLAGTAPRLTACRPLYPWKSDQGFALWHRQRQPLAWRPALRHSCGAAQSH